MNLGGVKLTGMKQSHGSGNSERTRKYEETGTRNTR